MGASEAELKDFGAPKRIDFEGAHQDSINGLMEVARHRGLEVQLLDRRTSGDTAGDGQRVVGYASFALYAPD